MTVPYNGDVQAIRNRMLNVVQDDELKRMYLYKVDVVPLGKSVNDEPAAKITVVFRVIDNPLIPVAAWWAITTLIGSAGSWLVIDKVEDFTSTGTGSIVSILGLAATILGIYAYVKG